MPTQTPEKRKLFASTPRKVFRGVFVGVLVLIALTGVKPSSATAATTGTLNFQAKLMTSSGAIAADGNYNVEFNLYTASSGGTSLWTEDHLVSGSNYVHVVNGYLTTNLGSITAFPGTINWDQDLYLGMTVRGTASCAFGSCTPADGEMTPRLKLTASPYAFSAGKLSQYNGATTFTSTLTLQGPTVGNQNFVVPDQGAAGTYNLLTTTAADGSYIKLQGTTPGTAQTGNFNITGTGIAASLQAPLFQTIDQTAGSTNSASLVLRSGNAAGTTSNSGNITIDVGTATGTAGAVNIGTTNATAITVGRATIQVSIPGGLTTNGSAITTANGNLTLGSGNITTTGTYNTNTFTSSQLQFGAASAAAIYSANGQNLTLDTGNTTGTLNVGTGNASAVSVGKSGADTTVNGGLIANGSQFTNNGSTLLTATTLSNYGSNAAIGTAAATVDVFSTFKIPQTTAGITLSLPTPTTTTAGRLAYVINTGSQPFTMHTVSVAAGKAQTYVFDGSNWTATNIDGAGSGATFVGTIDTQTKSTDGAVISGNGIYLQTADATSGGHVGIVSTGAQSFAGAKTFAALLTGQLGATLSGAAVSLNDSSNFNTTINTGTSTGTVTIGNSAAGAISLQSATSIGLTGVTNVNVSANNATNINTGTSTGAVSIGNSAAGAIAIQSGTSVGIIGVTNINASANNATNINTGTSTGAVTIGNSAAGAIGIQSGGNITITSNTSSTGTIVKSATNSSSAFQVQNSAGNSALNVNTITNNVSLLGSNTGDTGTWTSNTNQPAAGRQFPGAVFANGYMYIIGGSDATPASSRNVYYAKVNADGTPGTWTSSTNILPGPRAAGPAAYSNGRLYVFGGIDSGGNATTSIYYAIIGSDGAPGVWQTEPAHPITASRAGASAVILNGYAYVIDGEGTASGLTQAANNAQSTNYYAKINADGTIGTWGNAGSTSQVARRYHSSVTANGYIYQIGGQDTTGAPSTTVQYTKQNADGTVGSWSTANALPAPVDSGAAVVANGYVYYIGGRTTSGTIQTAIYYAKINNDGTLGSWQTSAATLVAGRYGIGAVTVNGNIYALDGNNSGVQTTVYSAPVAKVQINGNLDLVGLQGGTLTDGGSTSQGSVGGSITAGNIVGVGTLTIQGDANFTSSLSVAGTLNVGTTGVATTSFLTPLVDVPTGGSTLSLGTGTATAVSLGKSGITTTNNGALTVTQLLTANLGANISGATVNINASSNFATNINTGTSTGAIGIGNSAAGAITIASGAGVSITGGAASSITTTTGNLTLDSAATVSIGGTNATNVSIGRNTQTVSVAGATTISNNLTVTNAGALATQRGSDYSTTGSQNDVNLGTSGLVRLTGASTQTITGIAGGVDGRILTLVNAAAQAASLRNDNTSSTTAGDRILTGTGTDIAIAPDASITLIYDGSSNRWRVTGASAASGGYVQLQTSTPGAVQNGHFNINGTGIADTLQGTSHVYTANLDVVTAGTLTIGNNVATAITIGKSGVTTTDSGALTVAQLLTGQLGATISGATVSLNDNSNFTTNLNTGTSTGAVNIGNSAAGAITLATGSTFGLTAGGGITIATSNTTTSAAVSIKSGNSSAGTAGTVTIDNGTSSTGTSQINLGTANAGAIAIGRTGINTTISGGLVVGASAGTGSLTNNGSTVNSTLAKSDFASGGSIGTAATTVDIYTAVSIAQTTASQTITIPTPTANTTYGRLLYVSNIGTASFTLLGSTVSAGSSVTLVWSNTNGGAAWTIAGANAAGNYIQNQNGSSQTANFRISGTGQADTSILTPTLDVATAGILSLGTATANAVSLGKSGVTTTNNGALTVTQLLSGNLGATISGAAVSINDNSNFATTINTGTSTGAVTIGNSAAGAIGITTGSTFGLTAGGAITIATSNTTASAAVSIKSGNSSAGTAGTVTIDNGTSSTGTSQINLGTANAGAIAIGRTGINTTISGGLVLGASAGTGSLTNNGSTTNATLAKSDFASGGSIGTAATTVDIYTAISVAQTTASQTLTIPTPTASTTYGKMLYLSNIGTAGFTLLGSTLNPGATASLIWANTNGGATWQYAGADGSAIQNQNSTTQTANFKISGSGTAVTSFLTPTVDVATAGTLSLGTSTATAITLGKSGITTTNSGALTVAELLTGQLGATISGATVNVNASSNFATNINTGTSTGAVNIGNSAAGAIAIQSGTSVGITGVTNINASANNATNINTGTSTGAVNIGNSAAGAIGITTGSTFGITATGAVTIATSNTTASAAVSIKSGDSSAGTAGTVTLDTGTSSTGTSQINIGTANAGAIAIGKTTITTTINGSLTAGASAGTGTFTNNGSTKNTSLALGDLAAGAIGTAAATVNIYTSFTISPTASGRTYTIPAPTDGAAGRTIYISNINATNTFIIGSTTFNPHSTATLVYDGSSWNFAGMDGGSSNYIQNQTATPQTAGFNISGAGTLGGLLTANLGLTVTGAVASINASSNFATNINTGTSTGAVSIGNSAAGAIAIQSGTSIGLTGVTNINASANNATNINTGTSTGAVTIGNTAAGAIGITTGSTFGVTATGTITIATSNAAVSAAVSLQSGNSTAGTAGTVTIDTGTSSTGTSQINIGTTNAGAVTIGQTTTTTTVKGNLTAGNAAGTGVFTNNGSTKNISLALGDLAAGAIGTAAATVNIYTSFTISPTASGRTYTIPAPTDGAAGRTIYISNINATNTFIIGSTTFNTHSTATLVYDGTSWNFAGMDGGSNNYIQNQTATPQTAGFNISGAGTLGGLLSANLGAAISGAISSINASSNFATNINTGTSTGAINIGNSAAGAIAIQSGTSVGITGVTNINSSANNATNINTGTSTGAVTIGNSAAGVIALQSGGNINLTTNTSATGVVIKSATNSTAALVIQNASSTLLTLDTTTNTIDSALNILNDGNVYLYAVTDGDVFAVSGTNNIPQILVDTAGGGFINNSVNNFNNSLTNPGFELGTNPGSGGYGANSTGWQASSTANIQTDATNARSGNKVYRMTAAGQDKDTSGYFAVHPGDTIYYEGYVKHAAGGTGTGGFFMEATDKDKLNAVFSTDVWTDPGTSYTLRANTYTVPAGKYYIRMAMTLRSGATGNWYYDDLYMRQSNDQTPMTYSSGVTIGSTAGTGNLTNNGTTVNAVSALSNFASNQAIGTAANTVDKYTNFSIPQTTSSITLTIPTPTSNTTYGRVIYISNIGTAAFQVQGATSAISSIFPGATAGFVWSNTNGGATWQYMGDGSAFTNGGNSFGAAPSIGTNDNFGITIKTNNTTALSIDTSQNVTMSGSTLSFVQGGSRTINIAQSTTTTGNDLTIAAGQGFTNFNGGNLVLGGGSGTGTGVQGLVKLSPTVFNSSGSTQSFAANGSITGVDSFSTVAVTASTTGLTVTLPVPTNQVVGRILYVTAVNGTNDFNLALANTSGVTGSYTIVGMKANNTATLVWNGFAWTAAGASSSTDLQSAYNNTLSSAGAAELVVSSTSNHDGLTIRDSTTAPVNGTLLEVQTASAASLFSVNGSVTDYATDGGAETAGGSSSTFPASTWAASGASTVSRYTTTGSFIATGQASTSVATTTAANDGVKDTLSTTLNTNVTYNVSFTTRLASGTFTDMNVYYSIDGTAASVACVTGKAIKTSVWTKVNCSFAAPSSGITSSNAIFIRQTGSGTARTFYVDNLSVTIAADYNLATDGGVDDNTNFATNWNTAGLGTVAVSRNTSDGNDASDSATANVTAGATNAGIRNKLSINPLVSTLYRVSVYAKLNSGTAFTDFKVRYSRDAGTNFVDCVDYNTQTVVTTGWTQITCYITTDGTAPSGSGPYVYFVEAASGVRNYSVDTFSMTLSSASTPNVQIGGGLNGGPVTLLTLDRAAAAPIAANNDALLGSMYYDTTLGKLQCYESDGWGACGSSPDNIVTLSPEYTNAVLHGTGVGTMTSDLCSDALNINDGSSSQPTICGTNETYNFYKWTSPQATSQTYSIYVTYQLPTTFKSFASGQTSLMGRTDNGSSGGTATVQYSVYRNIAGTGGLSQCGSTVTVSTGTSASWQTQAATGAADPSTCGFAASDSIIFKIDGIASKDANSYIGNLGFTFSNK